VASELNTTFYNLLKQIIILNDLKDTILFQNSRLCLQVWRGRERRDWKEKKTEGASGKYR